MQATLGVDVGTEDGDDDAIIPGTVAEVVDEGEFYYEDPLILIRPDAVGTVLGASNSPFP